MSHRWLVAAALFTVVFSASSPIAAFGVFLPALADTFGWSRGAISVALSITLLLGGLGGFVVGAVADRHGPRGILLLTVAIAGGGFALASTTAALWHLYLFVGVMGGLGTSGFYVIAASTVTRWFERERGLALALVLAGFNVSFVTGGPVAAWLIERLGWRPAYLVFGGWLCLVGGLAGLVVRDPPRRPPAPGQAPAAEARGATLRDALADRRLWLLSLCWSLFGGVFLMVSVHVVPYARDRGVALGSASLALTAYGLGATVGRLVFGALSDRLGGRAIMPVCVALQVGALAALAWGPSQHALLLLLAVFGLGFTGADTVFVRAIPDVFGLRALGAITGVLTIGWRSGAALGPAVAGFAHDATGSYTLPFGLAPVALAVSYALFRLGSAPRGGSHEA
ncbi:MAG: MFS transporter [Candidatus Rokubacteria bacterium]|nr:MFS transporter [Candidatus Rokubacteria bacterium]